MKTKHLRSTLFFLALWIGQGTFASHLSDHLILSAKLDGGQEVPAVTTDASGIASFILNDGKDSLCFSVNVQGLSGPITGIHVHEAAIGMNGGVVTDLSPFINGNRVETIITGADLTPAMLAKYLSGAFYLNVHTAANPNGEIRGQITLETDWSFTVALDGAQENPPVATNAYGVGQFILAKHSGVVNYNVVVQGLSGAIMGAHLHIGAVGVNGAVEQDLSGMVNGNMLSGSFVPTAVLLDNLMIGSVYLNVHTADNPGGEIRSQLNNLGGLSMDAWLNGGQEVPPVATSAMGAANITLNNTMDTLWYDAAMDGLSGAIMGAHFHEGTAGNNGGVLLDLSGSVSGNRLTGMVTDGDITNDLVNSFLSGGIYLNIHTAANPGGEVRGQVYRHAREGYAYNFSGEQEVPMVTTNAAGGGMVSIDRDQSNAHVMMVVSDLSGTLMGAHFHNNVAGMNGGVVYDLTPWFSMNGANDAAYGYWKAADGFTTANSVQFRNDSIYVNLHTAANPNGEVRGQVLRGGACEDMSTGIYDIEPEEFLDMYPNPANSTVTISFKDFDGPLELEIVDLTGKLVRTETLTQPLAVLDVSELTPGLYVMNVKGKVATRLMVR